MSQALFSWINFKALEEFEDALEVSSTYNGDN